MLNGIDISHHNKLTPALEKIIYQQDFCFMKATEGRTYVDPTFKERLTEFEDGKYGNCMPGAYHFARPDNGNSAESEALNFVAQVLPHIQENGYMLLSLDIEGKALQHKLIGAWAHKWLQKVYELTGVRPVVYIQESALGLFNNEPNVTTTYGLWCAKHTLDKSKTPKRGKWAFWAFWQWGIVNGIDQNLFNGNEAALMLYAKSDIYPKTAHPEEEPETGECHCGCAYCCESEE